MLFALLVLGLNAKLEMKAGTGECSSSISSYCELCSSSSSTTCLKCKDVYYHDNGYCIGCSYSCENCIGTSTNCTSCIHALNAKTGPYEIMQTCLKCKDVYYHMGLF